MSRVFLLAAIVLAAIGFRFWQIGTLPPGFHLDESFEGLEAWRILTEASYRPVFLTGNFGVPPLNAYANAITFGLFRLLGGEVGPVAMRATAAMFGVLGVLAIYALASELRRIDAGRLTVALPFVAAAILATLRWHVHFSRIGIEPILVPLLWSVATWLYLRGWRTGGWVSFAACGVALAAAMYTYQAAWILPFLMIPTAAHLGWHSRHGAADLDGEEVARRVSSRTRMMGLSLTVGVAVLLVLPLAWFFVQHPDLLLLRPTQIAVTDTVNPSTQGSIWQNVRASVLMFVPLGQTGDLDPRRNLPGAAALSWWQFLPFALGLIVALRRLRSPAYSIPLIGLIGLLLPGIFSEYAPHFHRVLGAAAPAVLFCGFGLDFLIERARPRAGSLPLWRNWGVWVSVVLIVGGGVTSARDYFVRWAALPDLFYAFDAGLWQIGQDVAHQPLSTRVYLTPRSADHPTLAFAGSTRPGSHDAPISFDGRTVFPVVELPVPQPETYVAIETEDFRTRLLLPEVLPSALVTQTIYDATGEVYARSYVRPAGAPALRPPQHALPVALGDGIALAGYDVQPATLRPGDILYLQLHWRVAVAPREDWTVFTHLLAKDANGDWAQVAGRDDRPGAGSLPTTRWQPGWRVLDEYQIALPPDLEPGDYALETGLYGSDGARLPANGAGVRLGEVTIE